MKTGTRSQALYCAADLRSIERTAAEQPLMERAGLAAAELATSLCRLQERAGMQESFAPHLVLPPVASREVV